MNVQEQVGPLIEHVARLYLRKREQSIQIADSVSAGAKCADARAANALSIDPHLVHRPCIPRNPRKRALQISNARVSTRAAARATKEVVLKRSSVGDIRDVHL